LHCNVSPDCIATSVIKKKTAWFIIFATFAIQCGGIYMSKSEQTRQYIIEKTAPVFNAKGYAGTSMNDIMEVTGLSKGCIYGIFQSKDEVAVAAFEFNHQRVNDHMKQRIMATENAVERLLVYPKTYRNYFRYAYLQAGCPILNTATEADDTHPLLRSRAAKALSFWITAIEKQIKRGIERKEIKQDTSAQELAVVMVSLIEGAFMQAKLSGKINALQIAMDYLENIIKERAV
jgi:TetR/AcrR family transcriptional repressor of nem operon